MEHQTQEILHQAMELGEQLRTDRRTLHQNPEVGPCLPQTK